MKLCCFYYGVIMPEIDYIMIGAPTEPKINMST